jgi:hypothetical protein
MNGFKTLTITNKVLKGIYHIAQLNSHRLNIGQAHSYRIDDAAEGPLSNSIFFTYTNIEPQPQ